MSIERLAPEMYSLSYQKGKDYSGSGFDRPERFRIRQIPIIFYNPFIISNFCNFYFLIFFCALIQNTMVTGAGTSVS